MKATKEEWAMAKRGANAEMLVRPLGWEDSLEEDMATHSSVPAWKIPKNEGAWRATVHSVAKSQT